MEYPNSIYLPWIHFNLKQLTSVMEADQLDSSPLSEMWRPLDFQAMTDPTLRKSKMPSDLATGITFWLMSSVGLEKRTLAFDMGIPQMTIIGNYELTGNLFIFPIAGTGNFWLSLVGISARGRGDLKVVQTNGKRRLQLQSVDLDLRIQGMKAHLTNLFNGDKLLGT